MQEAVYADLLPGERTRLHRQLAETLTEHPEFAAELGVGASAALAQHWYAAREVERAFETTIEAALAAEQARAMSEAHLLFERVIELFPLVSGTSVPLDLPSLLRRTAEAAHLAGDDARALALVERAIELVGEDPLRRAMLHERRGRYLYTGGADEASTIAAYEGAVRLVPEHASHERAWVLASLAQVLMLTCRYTESHPHCEAAIEIARAAGAHGAEAHTLATDGINAAHRGDVAAALDLEGDAMTIGLRSGDLEAAFRAYTNLAAILTLAMRTEAATATAEEGAAASIEAGFPSAASYLLGCAAEVHYTAGRFDRAQQDLDAAAAGLGHVTTRGRYHLSDALLKTTRGDLAGAADALEQAHTIVSTSADKEMRGLVLAAQAEHAIWSGDNERAVRYTREGLTALGRGEETGLMIKLAWLGTRAGANLVELGPARTSLPAVFAEAHAPRRGTGPDRGGVDLPLPVPGGVGAGRPRPCDRRVGARGRHL